IQRGVEHPFGTIKTWMGATHFKTSSLKRVATETTLRARGLKVSGRGFRAALETHSGKLRTRGNSCGPPTSRWLNCAPLIQKRGCRNCVQSQGYAAAT